MYQNYQKIMKKCFLVTDGSWGIMNKWLHLIKTLSLNFKATCYMYEWMNDRLSYSHMWTCRVGATWKRNAYNKLYSGNSLNVCICLTPDNWRISLMADSIIFNKCLEPKIVLPHGCQIFRLMNKTPPQSIMPTGSENKRCTYNTGYNLVCM